MIAAETSGGVLLGGRYGAKNSIHNEHGPPEHAARPAAASSVARYASWLDGAPCVLAADRPARPVGA